MKEYLRVGFGMIVLPATCVTQKLDLQPISHGWSKLVGMLSSPEGLEKRSEISSQLELSCAMLTPHVPTLAHHGASTLLASIFGRRSDW
jgi:hypothetical protein